MTARDDHTTATHAMQQTLPPFAWSEFKVKHPTSVGAAGLTDPLPWSLALSRQLAAVNDKVNNAIMAKPDSRGLGDTWDLFPAQGNCNDFAVSKRDELLKAGLPASCLLLAEVVIADGEHHLVLIVRTSQDDIVLDNLTVALLSKQDMPYRMVRMQAPDDPNKWVA